MLQLNTFIMKINSRLSATPILSLLTILMLTFTSCKKDNSVSEPVVYGDASLKVVNTVQGSLAQDFFQNDTKISTTPVAYGEATGYLTIKAGNSTISYKNTGSTTVNATAGLGLNTNDSFTVFYVSNANGSGGIIGFLDDTVAPVTGKAKVRFVNIGAALTNTINVNITGGAALATGLQYTRSSVYSTIDVNTGLTATVLGSTTPISIPGVTFQTGKIYTVWFDAASSTSLNYHVIQQN